MTSPVDSHLVSKRSDDQSQRLSASANHDSPVCVDDDLTCLTASAWVHAPQSGTSQSRVGAAGDGVTVHRCRSDDTLSSTSDWCSRDVVHQATDGPRRYQVQMYRPPLSRRNCVFVESSRQGSGNFEYMFSETMFSSSAGVDKSSQHHHGPHVVVV